jgi:hypothetical protein
MIPREAKCNLMAIIEDRHKHEAARRAGARSFMDGASIKENPYEYGSLAQAWIAGYMVPLGGELVRLRQTIQRLEIALTIRRNTT